MLSLRSEITKRVLNYFFINPQDSLYVNELARKLDLDKRNLVKKVKELEIEGILKSQKRGNLKLYSINKDYPLYKEYKNIVLKTVGLEDRLKRILLEIKDIESAYIYGSYAQNKMDAHSDIDLLVVGNHDIILLQRKLNKIQKELDREINATSMDPKEYNRRIGKKDSFIMDIIKKRHIKLL